jgi:hypothetical protein
MREFENGKVIEWENQRRTQRVTIQTSQTLQIRNPKLFKQETNAHNNKNI